MRTLYLDMDGVVADFDAYANAVLSVRSENGVWQSETWRKLREHQRIYRDLPKTTEADDLVKFCCDLCTSRNWRLIFLTAVPKGNDFFWAFQDKLDWVRKYYPDIPVHFGPYSVDKQLHCLPGDILVDDRLSNIQEWTAAGGNAIRHLGDLGNTISLLSAL